MTHDATVSRYGDRSLVSAWIDQERREELVELARRQDRSVSSIVRRAIDRELQREAKLEGAASTPLGVVPSKNSEGEPT